MRMSNEPFESRDPWDTVEGADRSEKVRDWGDAVSTTVSLFEATRLGTARCFAES